MKTYILKFNYYSQDWDTFKEFNNYDELLDFLAKRDWSSCINNVLKESYFNRDKCCYLDGINMNGNDTYLGYDLTGNQPMHFIRPYIFIDEKDKILDPRKDLDLIKEKRDIFLSKPYHYKYPEFEFRKGPVPGTFYEKNQGYKEKHYRPWAYRHMRYRHLVEDYLSDDFKKFGRKDKSILTWWVYEKVRSTYHSRSWKDNTYCKKQWQKNLK